MRLPEHWPRHVRSAIVHAVSMANVAFTITQARVPPPFMLRFCGYLNSAQLLSSSIRNTGE
jgi:hypothetical protein